MERFETLQTLSPQEFDGCPVSLAAGLLLRDCLDDSVVLQIKLQNTGALVIRSVILDVQGQYASGIATDAIPQAIYRDIFAGPGTCFGDRKAISLPDPATASVQVSVRAVSFENGTLWTAPGASNTAGVKTPVRRKQPTANTDSPVTSAMQTRVQSWKAKQTRTAARRRNTVDAEDAKTLSTLNIVRLILLGLLVAGMAVAALYLYSLNKSKNGSGVSTDTATVQGVSLDDLSAARYDNMVTGYWTTKVVSLKGKSYSDSSTCSMFSAHLISGGTGFMEMNGVKYELRWGYYGTKDNMIYYSATMSGENCVMGYSTDRDSPYYHCLIITMDEDTSLVMQKS